MRGLNQAQIIGHAGKDAELRYLPNGTPVANFTLATTEVWKDKATGEKRSETEWHNIVCHGKPAEIAAQYVKKGSLVFVQGSLHTRRWKDKQTGQDRQASEIKAGILNILSWGKEGGQAGFGADPSNTPGQPKNAPNDDLDDDIPF